MRLAASIFIAAHGIGFSIWFMSAWTPAALDAGPTHVTLLPDTPSTGAVGKALGLLALVVLVGFVATAWGVWQQTPWWPTTMLGATVASLFVAVAVWNPVGIVSVPAVLASLALLVATVTPLGERYLGPH
jgi:hypothetical protein